MTDDNKSGQVKVTLQGGEAQGIIGAHEVNVEHLVINNYHRDGKISPVKSREKTAVIQANPYKGLAHFGPNDAKNFFGRVETIHELKNKVEKQSFVAVIGHSGSGKSSVVLAGLAPELHESCILALAQALIPLYEPELNSTQRILQRIELAEGLRTKKLSISDILDTIKHRHNNKRVLLIADQFEELYTSNISLTTQHSFIDLLLTAANPSSEMSITPSLSSLLYVLISWVLLLPIVPLRMR